MTSANRRGEPAPGRFADVPAELRELAAVVVDGGPLPGVASTVVDITGPGAGGDSAGTGAHRLASGCGDRRADVRPAPRDRPGGGRRRHRGPHRSRARAPARPARADRVRELHLAGGARGGRIGADQQVRRGLPGAALLRRVRVGRRGRAARDRPGEGPVRRRPRQRPAARRRAGEPGGVLRAARARRPDPGAAARPRRPPDARPQGQLLGPALRRPCLRRPPRGLADRLRRGGAAGEGVPAAADRRGGVGVSPRHRG